MRVTINQLQDETGQLLTTNRYANCQITDDYLSGCFSHLIAQNKLHIPKNKSRFEYASDRVIVAVFTGS